MDLDLEGDQADAKVLDNSILVFQVVYGLLVHNEDPTNSKQTSNVHDRECNPLLVEGRVDRIHSEDN